MNNLKLRTKLLAIAVPPLVVLAMLVAYAMKVAFVDGASLDVDDVRSNLEVFGLIGLAGLLASALVLILVTRSVTAPLDRLTQAADELSNTRLPALVELLRNAEGAELEQLADMSIEGDDELSRLAAALGSVHSAAAQVTAAQRGLVKESISALVVNLARRNQALLDRQLQFIDELETKEDDPDRLEQLYRLDHLATRMRRNAESLLVLAGAETPRRRGAPVQLLDVVRVAMGEIEDYRHIELAGIQPAMVGASAAVDLSHLLAELMENATQFSPPDAPVIVEGGRTGDGTYTVTVLDRGIGMGERQLADANDVLSNPPELGLELSRSLGFLVVGRLAKRLGVAIALRPTPGGGVTATVTVPADVLVAEAGSAPTVDRRPQHRSSGLAPAPGSAAAPIVPLAAPVVLPAPASEPPAAAAPPAAGPDDAPFDGLPWYRQGAPAPTPGTPADAAAGGIPLLADLRPDGDDAPPVPSTAPRPDPTAARGTVVPASAPVPPLGAEPPPADRLADALPLGKAFEDGLAALLAPPAEAPGPERTDAGLVRRRRGEQAPPEQNSRPVAASGRTPEEIRAMLARYRDGIKHRRPAADTGIATPLEEDPR